MSRKTIASVFARYDTLRNACKHPKDHFLAQLPISSLKRFKLPAAPRMADPSVRSGHRSALHHAEETPHILVFLITLHYWNKRLFCCTESCGMLHQKYCSSHGAKLVRFSFHLQQHQARGNSYHSYEFALLSETPPLRNLVEEVWFSLKYTGFRHMQLQRCLASVNCDLHLPEIKIRCSALITREEKFNSKIQRVSSALANHGSHKSPFIGEKHNHRAFAGVN